MRIFPLNLPHFEIGIISSSIIFLIIVLKIIFDLKKGIGPFYFRIKTGDYIRIAILTFAAGGFFEKQEAPFYLYHLVLIFLIFCYIMITISGSNSYFLGNGYSDLNAANVYFVAKGIILSVILLYSLLHHYGKHEITSMFERGRKFELNKDDILLTRITPDFLEYMNNGNGSGYFSQTERNGAYIRDSLTFHSDHSLILNRSSAKLISGVREAFREGYFVDKEKGTKRPYFQERRFGSTAWLATDAWFFRHILLVDEIVYENEKIKILKQSEIMKEKVLDHPLTLEDVNGDLWWICVYWCLDGLTYGERYQPYQPKYRIDELRNHFY